MTALATLLLVLLCVLPASLAQNSSNQCAGGWCEEEDENGALVQKRWTLQPKGNQDLVTHPAEPPSLELASAAEAGGNDPTDLLHVDTMVGGIKMTEVVEEDGNGELDEEAGGGELNAVPVKFTLRGKNGRERVTITGPNNQSMANVTLCTAGKAFELTLPADSPRFTVVFLNDAAFEQDVFMKMKSPNMAFVDIQHPPLWDRWNCGSASENVRCSHVRNGLFAWAGPYVVTLEKVRVKFTLQGKSGREKVTITGPNNQRMADVALRTAEKAFELTLPTYLSRFTILFINDAGSEQDVFMKMKSPNMAFVDIQHPPSWDRWNCQRGSGNERCSHVRNGLFLWAGPYVVALKNEVRVKFTLRGKSGREKVTITGPNNQSMANVGLCTAERAFELTLPAAESPRFTVLFINDGHGQDVFMEMKSPDMASVDIQHPPYWDRWNCRSANGNERCSYVRNGMFAWGGPYDVTLKKA